MGQVSVLVSVFGGETVNQKMELLPVTCDIYDDYYYCWLTRDIIVITEYLWDGSTSGIFIMIISFKALYVASLRRPTVAFLLKPFMWRRSDARLWHYLLFVFISFYTTMLLQFYKWLACTHQSFIYLLWLTSWAIKKYFWHIIVITEYLWDGSTSGIFIMIISFKALYVVSLRRPTVALLAICFINFYTTMLLHFYK